MRFLFVACSVFATVTKRTRRDEPSYLIGRAMHVYDVSTADESFLSPVEKFNLTWNYLKTVNSQFRDDVSELLELTSVRNVFPFFKEIIKTHPFELRIIGLGALVESIVGGTPVNASFLVNAVRDILHRVKTHCMYNYLPNSLRLNPPFHTRDAHNSTNLFQSTGAHVDFIKEHIHFGEGVVFDQTVPNLPLFGSYDSVIPGKLLLSEGFFSSSLFIQYESGCVLSHDLPHFQLIPTLRVAAHATRDLSDVQVILANTSRPVTVFSERHRWRVGSIALKPDAAGTGFWLAVVARFITTGGSRRSRILVYHSSALNRAVYDTPFFNLGMTATFKGDALLYSGPTFRASVDLHTLERSAPETASTMEYYLPRRSDFYVSWNSQRVTSRSHFYSQPVLEFRPELGFSRFRVIVDGDYVSCISEDFSFRVKLTKYRMMRTMSRLCAKRRFRAAVRRPCAARASWNEIIDFLGSTEMTDEEMVLRFWDTVVPRHRQLMTPVEAAALLPRFFVDPETLGDCVVHGHGPTCRRIIAEFIQSQDATILDYEDVDDENILMRAFYLISNQSII